MIDGKVGSVDLDHRDVGFRIGSDNLGFELTLVGKSDAHGGGAVDDVVVGDDITVRSQDDART